MGETEAGRGELVSSGNREFTVPSASLARRGLELLTAQVGQAFRLALIRASAKRQGISISQATGLVDVLEIQANPVYGQKGEGRRKFANFHFPFDRGAVTEQVASGNEVILLGLVVDVVWACLEAHQEVDIVRVLLEEEQGACVLSVEATREMAGSLSWDNLDERQILENFDLRYAGGKPVVAHGAEPESNTRDT